MYTTPENLAFAFANETLFFHTYVGACHYADGEADRKQLFLRNIEKAVRAKIPQELLDARGLTWKQVRPYVLQRAKAYLQQYR